jgi:hypothetical protein
MSIVGLLNIHRLFRRQSHSDGAEFPDLCRTRTSVSNYSFTQTLLHTSTYIPHPQGSISTSHFSFLFFCYLYHASKSSISATDLGNPFRFLHFVGHVAPAFPTAWNYKICGHSWRLHSWRDDQAQGSEDASWREHLCRKVLCCCIYTQNFLIADINPVFRRT